MKEYEAGLTAEAELVKDLDKFEMILQAYEYEKGMVKQCCCTLPIKPLSCRLEDPFVFMTSPTEMLA